MPHERKRYAVALVAKLASLWPAIGVIGPRQCGKTTLLREQVHVEHAVTLDDEEILDAALKSAKVFLSRLELPVVIDEVQKAPAIFDALKAAIDRKKRPGQYYLTGSSQFSARIGIRESLTGRIGLLHFYPLTRGELDQFPFEPPHPLMKRKPRTSVEAWGKGLALGGMPVPAFMRDEASRRLYWQSWHETTVYRDVARFFKNGYDPRITLRILRSLKDVSLQGGLFSLDDIGIPAGSTRRSLQNYLSALEDCFVLRRINCHDVGIGKDHWLVFDSGYLNFLQDGAMSDQATLGLVRTFLWQEICALTEYATQRMVPTYIKSRKGPPVDMVWEGVPIKVITTSKISSLGWEKRALEGVMKLLKAPVGLLYAPVSQAEIPKAGIGIIPWGYWS